MRKYKNPSSTIHNFAIIIIILSISFIIIACGQLITPEPIVIENTPTPTEISITVMPTVTPKPTSTPKPATPEPTPTPTLTPTPIFYSVKRGDTLLGIAIAFDISAEAIQTANGIIDPRSLQIDQVLIIPSLEEEGEAEPTPTATPYPVTLQGISFIKSPQGSLWCFGEVFNPSSVTLSEIIIEVSLFDAQGDLLASEGAFTQLDILSPNQRVPFAVLFDSPPSSFAQYQISSISAVPIFGQTRYYLDLMPLETSATLLNQSTYRISGQLQNVGDSNAEGIKLVAVAYDVSNKVVAQRQAILDAVILRSQARTPFQIDLTVSDTSVDRYVVQAQALRSP